MLFRSVVTKLFSFPTKFPALGASSDAFVVVLSPATGDTPLPLGVAVPSLTAVCVSVSVSSPLPCTSKGETPVDSASEAVSGVVATLETGVAEDVVSALMRILRAWSNTS